MEDVYGNEIYNIISKVVIDTKFHGQVRLYLLGLVEKLPRSYIRGLSYMEGFESYTLFGLSGFVAYKLGVKLIKQALGNDIKFYPLQRRVVYDIDDRILPDAEFDGHYTDLETVRITGHNRMSVTSVVGTTILGLIFVGLKLKKLSALVCAYLFWEYLQTRYLEYMVNSSHYNDLISWSYGREKNASLFHAMRSRLYRKFYSEFSFTNETCSVFRDTLDAAFYAKRDLIPEGLFISQAVLLAQRFRSSWKQRR